MSEKKGLKVLTKEKGEEMGDLFGIFFEDLNHAADGGLSAELVQNRSFEFNPIDNKDYHGLTAWEKVERGNAIAEISVENDYPLNVKNTNYLTLNVIDPLYYSASLESSTGDVIVKVVNVQDQPVTAQIVLEDIEKETIVGTIFEMSGYELSDENSFDTPKKILPKQKDITITGNTLNYEFPKHSITVVRFH